MPRTESLLEQVKIWARRLKIDLVAIARAARDPRTPMVARALALLVIAYAASPIDLIPDFIPVLGLLDDLILLPLGIALVLRLIPKDVMAEHRTAVAAETHLAPSRFGLALVVGLWLITLVALAVWSKAHWTAKAIG
jgi:uncharacterized membrane protein YkvA (DUF1232 family)